MTNPKGNKKAKLLYFQSSRGHLKTGKSSKFKRRQKGKSEVFSGNRKSILRKVVNI